MLVPVELGRDEQILLPEIIKRFRASKFRNEIHWKTQEDGEALIHRAPEQHVTQVNFLEGEPDEVMRGYLLLESLFLIDCSKGNWNRSNKENKIPPDRVVRIRIVHRRIQGGKKSHENHKLQEVSKFTCGKNIGKTIVECSGGRTTEAT